MLVHVVGSTVRVLELSKGLAPDSVYQSLGSRRLSDQGLASVGPRRLCSTNVARGPRVGGEMASTQADPGPARGHCEFKCRKPRTAYSLCQDCSRKCLISQRIRTATQCLRLVSKSHGASALSWAGAWREDHDRDHDRKIRAQTRSERSQTERGRARVVGWRPPPPRSPQLAAHPRLCPVLVSSSGSCFQSTSGSVRQTSAPARRRVEAWVAHEKEGAAWHGVRADGSDERVSVGLVVDHVASDHNLVGLAREVGPQTRMPVEPLDRAGAAKRVQPWPRPRVRLN
eukprot:388591-Rhodomonas_salina.2